MSSEPVDYLCPISMSVMEDPVLVVETGVTYERQEIEAWLARGNNTCPCTGVQLQNHQLVPNRALKSAIDKWRQEDTGNVPSDACASANVSQPESPVTMNNVESWFSKCWPRFTKPTQKNRPHQSKNRVSTSGMSGTMMTMQSLPTKSYTPRRIANQMTLAVRQRDETTLSALRQKGWSFDVLDDRGEGPIHVAANQDDVRILSLLISFGASIEFREKSGCTALHWASRWGHVATCKSLLRNGASIDPQSLAGTTPLHMACYWGRVQLVQILVQHGADVHALNKKRETPIDFARRSPWDASKNVLAELQQKLTG